MKEFFSVALVTVYILKHPGAVFGGTTNSAPDFTAYNVALQAQSPNQGNGDFVVKCVITNPVQIKRVDLIGLQKKNNTKGTEITALFITRSGNITWQNQNLKKRPGLTATGDVSNVATAYLQISIAHDQVQCEKDSDNYACFMGGRLSSDGSLTTQFTGDYPVIFHGAAPTVMNGPIIRVAGSSVATRNRRFTVGSAIQLECTGEIGSDPDNPNPSIRWCSKSTGSAQFTPMPMSPSISATQRNGCMYTKTSSLSYTVTPIDTETQFVCESGYQSACDSGSAKGYVTISVEMPNIPTQARITTIPTTTSGGGFFWLPVHTTMAPGPQTQRPSSGALECDTCSDFMRSQCDGNLAPCPNVCMVRTHSGALITKCITDVDCEYQIIQDMIQPSSNTQCCTDNACFQKALIKGIHGPVLFGFLWSIAVCLHPRNPSTPNLEIRVSSELISGNHDVEVTCSIKNPVYFQKVNVMGLERFNKTRNYLLPVVFVTDGDKISWQNTDLRDRPGVNVEANIRSVHSAFLRFTIARDWVQFPDDDVTFACYLGGRTTENNTIDTQWTEEVGVSMQENPENTVRFSELNPLQCGFCSDLMTSRCARMYTPCYDACIMRRLPEKLQTQCVRVDFCSLYIVLYMSGAAALFDNEDFTAYNLVVNGPHTVRKGFDDLVISCEIDRRTIFREINLMGLEKRNGENEKHPVLFITDETKITWQDPYIQHRPGITVSGDITTVESAYLTYTISRDYVQCDNDSDSYSCFMGGVEKNGSMSTQFTKDYQVKVLDQPRHMETPVVRTGKSENPTRTRQFPVGTTIQIECSGEVEIDLDDPSHGIRWCSRAVGDTSMTPMPVTVSYNSRKINSCLSWKTSTLEYTVSAIDEETEIMCESGYQYACGSGTAKSNITIHAIE